MAEQGVFETRLRAALARYVADGPTDFDALEFARAVAAAEPRRHGRLGALHGPTVMVPRVAWLLLATALLLVALMASALFMGSRPDQRLSRPALDLSSWQRIILPVPAGSGTIGRLTDVAPGGAGYLAVGDGGSVGGLVWTSRDGLDWALVPTGDLFADAQLNAVVRTDEGYLAVGHDRFAGTERAAAWRSVDGRTWRPATSIVDRNGGFMDDVAFAGGRYVAVGTNVAPGIWLSDDAEHWRPAGDFTLGPSYLGFMTGVAAGGPGFVAVGPDPGVWVSADGDLWTRSGSAGDAPTPGQLAYDVVSGPGGRVIVATGAGLQVSDDGAAWTSHTLPTPGSSDVVVTGLTLTSSGYAAISASWNGSPLLWTSRDGTTWVLHGLDIEPRSSLPLGLFACGDALIVSAGNGTWALPGGGSGTTAP